MAITIMGGLFVATFLTLLYLPGLYALWFRKSLGQRGTGTQIDAAAQHQGLAGPVFPVAQAAE
jgi:multidrug efflux pump